MATVLYFADPSNGRPGRGATIRLDSGEACTVSFAPDGIRMKASRFGWFGRTIFRERNPHRVRLLAIVLECRFPSCVLPDGFTDPILRAFANAIMHCANCSGVATTVTEAVAEAKSLKLSDTPL